MEKNVLLIRPRRASEQGRRTQVQLPIRLVTNSFLKDVKEIRSLHDSGGRNLIRAYARDSLNTIKIELPEIGDYEDPLLIIRNEGGVAYYQAVDSSSELGAKILSVLAAGLDDKETLSTLPRHLEKATWWRFSDLIDGLPSITKTSDVTKPADPVLEAVRNRHRLELEGLNNKQSSIKEGFVYIISNVAWPGMKKVGSAIDPEKRLDNYQTYDPYRGYVLEYYQYADDRRFLERRVQQDLVALKVHGSDEWFACTLEQAKSVMELYLPRQEVAAVNETTSSVCSGDNQSCCNEQADLVK